MNLPDGEGAWLGGWAATLTPMDEEHSLLIVRSTEGMAHSIIPTADREVWLNKLKDDE